MRSCKHNATHRPRVLALASAVLLAGLASGQVTTFYGVQATLYSTVPGGMKMDYDAAHDRFVVQYQYGSIPPQYATIQRTTKALSHLAQTGGTTYKETLFSVLPTTWAGHTPGTAFVPAGGGGTVYSISPVGSVAPFATGLPSGNEYSTVHWDSVGVFGHDLLYADEGTGQVWRINSSGVGTPVATLRDGSNLARPEPILVLGSNPRYGNLQNQALVGQNLPTSTYFSIDASHNVTAHTLPAGILPSNGGSLDCFRIFPVVTPNTSIYAMLYGGTSHLYELSNLGSVPNLQAGDLLVGVETLLGGRVYHTYYDAASSQWNWNLLAEFQNIGFLENVVIAPSSVPVPEPGTLLLAGASLAAALRRRRR
ncbi:MAG: PEP-CTERM sorting domain-containing protein [Fimbriimonadales bacterium]|nr:PEP-CTERM sorting domain-containing protein [Fimbriimonadales bacterium]